MLTKKQIKEYNESPYHCPYCGGKNISAEGFDAEAEGQKVLCYDCNEEWWDVYKFVGIEEIPEEAP